MTLRYSTGAWKHPTKPRPIRFGLRGLVAVAALTFTLTVLFLADPMNAVNSAHAECLGKEGC